MKYFTHVPHRLTMARELFDTVSDAIAVPHDSVFTHMTSWSQWLNWDLNENLLFLVLEDSPHYGDFPQDYYDYWSHKQEPTVFQDVRNLAIKHPEKTIVFMLQGNHYHDGYFDLPNVRIGKWYTVPENDLYAKLCPINDKDQQSEKIGISLNRQIRIHRLALCSLLYGLDLDNFCYISTGHLYKQLDKLSSTDFLDHNPWQYNDQNDHVKQIMCQGFSKMISKPGNLRFGEANNKDIYVTEVGSDTVLDFDNITNFENNLRPLYRRSFVELVSNRLFCEPTINIDEKFIHTIYGRNFPIMISSLGTVDLYRRFGFDMFDDIIDHSYDIIDNPIDRLYAAVNNNKHLLTDSVGTIRLWNQCQQRFDANLDFVKQRFHDKLRRLTLDESNRCFKGLLRHSL